MQLVVLLLMTSFEWFAQQARDAGLVMCCICFHGLPREQMWVDADGATWDVCRHCQSFEDGTHGRDKCDTCVVREY